MKKTIILSSIILVSLNANAAYFATLKNSNYTIEEKEECFAVGRMSLSDVTDDDIISSSEAAGIVNITGIVTGDVKNGDVVNLTVNNNDYTSVIANRRFSAEILGSDLVDDADRRIDASITLTKNLCKSKLVTANSNYQVDLN